MFTGFKRSLAIITALVVAVPVLMIWAAEGSECSERMRLMSPFF